MTPWPDADFPADPYPGARPPGSFVHLDGHSHPVRPDPSAPSGWRLGSRPNPDLRGPDPSGPNPSGADSDGLHPDGADPGGADLDGLEPGGLEPGGADLDEWLAGEGAAPLAGRVPVLAYGSNRNPSKISWMRAERGLTGPVVVLRARTTGLDAVWAAGLRVVDDQRPAVLTAAPGKVAEHAVWMVEPGQFAALDRVEGRAADPPRYRLARLRTGSVVLEDGAVADGCCAYLGAGRNRRPLLVDGGPVSCDDIAQDRARALTGEPAAGDGLDADTVAGDPHPEAWPPRAFVYGLLMPGQRSWFRIAPHATGEPRPAVLPGTVSDTGLGYPALTRDGGPGVPGYVVGLADPLAALPALDDYEGPYYRRIRVVLPDGTVCWTYLWIEPSVRLTPLPRGWPR